MSQPRAGPGAAFRCRGTSGGILAPGLGAGPGEGERGRGPLKPASPGPAPRPLRRRFRQALAAVASQPGPAPLLFQPPRPPGPSAQPSCSRSAPLDRARLSQPSLERKGLLAIKAGRDGSSRAPKRRVGEGREGRRGHVIVGRAQIDSVSAAKAQVEGESARFLRRSHGPRDDTC